MSVIIFPYPGKSSAMQDQICRVSNMKIHSPPHGNIQRGYMKIHSLLTILNWARMVRELILII